MHFNYLCQNTSVLTKIFFMFDQPSISLIIAFYNEELYLDRCLQSAVNQTYKNIEVVIINDGSTDNSLQIAEKYLNAFENVKLISIKNSGHAEARNVGLQNCSGSFVTFLDADDTLELNMMEVFTNKLSNFKFDIAICDITIYAENGIEKFNSKWNKSNNQMVNSKDLLLELYFNGISENIWAKFFKTEIAKQITFEKNLWFDDRPFLIEFLHISDSAIFIDEKLVNNYRRSSSITRRFLESKRIVDVYRVFELELKIYKNYKNLESFKDKIGKFTLDVLMDTYLMQIIDIQNIDSINEVRKVFISYIEKFKIEINTQNINLKLKDKIALQLLISPKLLGWNIINFIFSNLKKDRITSLKKLKNC